MHFIDLLSSIDQPLLLVLLVCGFIIAGGILLYRLVTSASDEGKEHTRPGSRRAKGFALLFGTIPVGGCLAVSLLFLFLVLEGGYSPIPPAYPGSKVYHRYTGTGSWGYTEFYTYTVDLPLGEMEQYYAQQMGKYCDDWTDSFEDAPDYYEYPSCRGAGCAIPRSWFEHYFSVVLCPMSENKTWVMYVNAHEEP